MDDPIRVLHVDDEPDFASMVGTFLEREDDRFEVVTAESASEGLDRLDGNGIDCVVSDYDMPHMDGLSFLDAVRDRRGDLPFILFTGKGSEEIASEAISRGVTDYMQKAGGTDQYAVLANRIANLVEQSRFETEIERTRERYRTLVEEATDVILVVAPDATITYASPSAERVLGRTPEELLGTNGIDPIHEDDQASAIEQFAELVEEPGRRRTIEFRYERPDGSYIWAEARGRNLLDDPAIDGIVVYTRDITERREREHELRETNRRYETLIENFPDGGVFLYDEDLRCVVAGGAGLRRVGLSADEIEGSSPSDRYPPAIADEIESRLRAAFDGEEALFDQTYEGRRYRIHVVPVRNERGEVEEVMAVSRDVNRHPD